MDKSLHSTSAVLSNPHTLTGKSLSAAQPQPNDRGEINAFVTSSALCRAALKWATPSPLGRCERDQRPKSSKAKASNNALICSFSADYSILYSTPKAAPGDNLSKLAV